LFSFFSFPIRAVYICWMIFSPLSSYDVELLVESF
jgi:hypothetical protein